MFAVTLRSGALATVLGLLVATGTWADDKKDEKPASPSRAPARR